MNSYCILAICMTIIIIVYFITNAIIKSNQDPLAEQIDMLTRASYTEEQINMLIENYYKE